MHLKFPTPLLKKWFLSHKRDLPWRKQLSPYAVWVSEVMLQQTQVKTVIPYFNRWMSVFPTVEDLAKAPLEKVIKLWEGLGYYSRARNLQKGAKEIVERYLGSIPNDPKKLMQISGIGPYTCGAILSFAFQKRATLIDGNVKRVISRFLGLELDFSKPLNHRQLNSLLEEILPDDEPWIFNEALMELGAMVCTPTSPTCSLCPLKKNCYANQNKMQEKLPIKPVRKKIIKLYRLVLVVEYNKKMLIQKQHRHLMQDLYEFPYFDLTTQERKNPLSHEKVAFWKKHSTEVNLLPIVVHSFTHYHVTLFPYHFKLSRELNYEEFEWFFQKELDEKPFSSGHRKVMAHFKEASF